jgi:hypothetical protein
MRKWLYIPYEDREAQREAERLGARFDTFPSMWYVPEGVDLTPFAQWLPKSTPSPETAG